MRWVALGGGIVIVVGTLLSVVTTLVVPRDTPARIADVVSRVFMPAFRAISRIYRSYERKDDFLAMLAPFFLLLLLFTWIGFLVAGYGLMLWGATSLDIASAYREVGSSMFTLGFVDTNTPAATVIDLASAGSGLGVLALLIGYLPAIYGAYNRRERTVTMLESRAGAPAWGPEILWRHQQIGILDSLPDFYLTWEAWCADVAETHSTYPVLLFFRSPHPLRNWLTGLLAVLDSAALYNALCPTTAPSEARLCLRMGFTSVRTLAEVMYIPFEHDPRPDTPIQLSYEDYIRGVDRLRDIGFPMERTPEEAWPHFRGWRVNYEEEVFALAERIVATPGAWSGTRSALGEMVIPTKRPVDRTPDEPQGTEFTRPVQLEERLDD